MTYIATGPLPHGPAAPPKWRNRCPGTPDCQSPHGPQDQKQEGRQVYAQRKAIVEAG